MKKPPHQLLSLSLFLSVFTSSSTIVRIKREEFQERVEQKKKTSELYIPLSLKKKEPLLDFSNINILKKHRYFFSSLTTSTIIISKLSWQTKKKTKFLSLYPKPSTTILAIRSLSYPPFRSVSFNFKRAKWNRALIRCNDVTAFTIHARRTRGIYFENARWTILRRVASSLKSSPRFPSFVNQPWDR